MRRREYKRKRDGLGNRGVFQELRVTLLEKSLLLGGWVRKILLVRPPTLPRLLILLPPTPLSRNIFGGSFGISQG